MDVLEIRDKRRNLEMMIETEIKSFEKVTNTQISDIQLLERNISMCSSERPEFIKRIEITIKL